MYVYCECKGSLLRSENLMVPIFTSQLAFFKQQTSFGTVQV